MVNLKLLVNSSFWSINSEMYWDPTYIFYLDFTLGVIATCTENKHQSGRCEDDIKEVALYFTYFKVLVGSEVKAYIPKID